MRQQEAWAAPAGVQPYGRSPSSTTWTAAASWEQPLHMHLNSKRDLRSRRSRRSLRRDHLRGTPAPEGRGPPGLQPHALLACGRRMPTRSPAGATWWPTWQASQIRQRWRRRWHHQRQSCGSRPWTRRWHPYMPTRPGRWRRPHQASSPSQSSGCLRSSATATATLSATRPGWWPRASGSVRALTTRRCLHR